MGKGKRKVLHGLKIVILRSLTNTLNPFFNYIWLLDLFIYLFIYLFVGLQRCAETGPQGFLFWFVFCLLLFVGIFPECCSFRISFLACGFVFSNNSQLCF